jgi:hypothetical protein
MMKRAASSMRWYMVQRGTRREGEGRAQLNGSSSWNIYLFFYPEYLPLFELL